MKVSTGTVLPDQTQAGLNASRTPGGGKNDAEFSDILRQAGQDKNAPAPLHGQKLQSVDGPIRHPHWPEFAGKFANGDGDGDTGEVKADDADKSSDGDATTDGGKVRHGEQHQHRDQMQNPLSMMAALSGTGLESASGSTSAGEAAPPVKQTHIGNGQTEPAAPETDIDPDILSHAALASGKPSATKTPGETLSLDTGPKKDALPADPAADAESTPPKPLSIARAKLQGDGQAATHASADAQAPSTAHGTVIGAQSFPAPASYPSITVTNLAAAIANDNGARQTLASSAGLASTPSVAQPSHILKIELHPAELGVVTANLRLAGGQLSIELKPENQEAHRRLSADTDTLVKSLQAMGFDVDKVTVLQPSVAVNAPHRADTPGAAANPGGRDPSSFQPGNSGGNDGAAGGQQSGRNRNDEDHNAGRSSPHPVERAGGDLFI